MTDEPTHYRGIVYSIQPIGKNRWRWALHPPDGIIDYKPASGEVIGARTNAVAAAKREIERQDRRVAKYIRTRIVSDENLS